MVTTQCYHWLHVVSLHFVAQNVRAAACLCGITKKEWHQPVQKKVLTPRSCSFSVGVCARLVVETWECLEVDLISVDEVLAAESAAISASCNSRKVIGVIFVSNDCGFLFTVSFRKILNQSSIDDSGRAIMLNLDMVWNSVESYNTWTCVLTTLITYIANEV